MHFLFIDDAIEPPGDAERYRALLSSGNLSVAAVAPDRESLLVPEGELPAGIDGFILDINLRDHVSPGRQRFLGTGAGLAQDLRLMQALGGAEGQRARPIVRLCADQVFQQYIADDNSTADVFDLGFDKETIADNIDVARAQISALPEIYEGVIAAGGRDDQASTLLGLPGKEYDSLHSAFRSAFELELSRKPHEAANFLVGQLLLKPGLLIGESLLAVRLGIDLAGGKSPGWFAVKEAFKFAAYEGRGGTGFPRWWMEKVLMRWADYCGKPLYALSAEARVSALQENGFAGLAPLVSGDANPGPRPWAISQSDVPELRLPVDPNFGYPINTGCAPWLDEPLWCLEQAKRQRRSLLMTEGTRSRLAKDLKAKAAG